MNLPNFKDILKLVLGKLSVFKNNTSLLISIIIALAAILLFIPTQLFSSSLKKRIQQESINDIAKKFDMFKEQNYSESQLKTMQESLTKFSDDVNNIELLAIQTTQRELLSYDIFNLDPNDANSTFSQSIFHEFGQKYYGKIDEFINKHNARKCPTQAEIENEMKASGIDSILSGTNSSRGYDNRPLQENIQGIFIDQICQKRAQSAFVYIDPTQIAGYDFWQRYVFSSWQEDIENCWYSQLAYWVIEDAFNTIASTNNGQESLLNAPVKRLMSISFSDEGTYSRESSAADTVTFTGMPQYIFSTNEIPKETPTGRYSDETHDVIHFKIKLVIKSNDFLSFIKQLCGTKEHKYIDKSGQSHTYKHNQITVLDTTIKSVDMRSPDHELYRYGDDNVSEIEFTCEYIFNVKGYEDLMPQSVKESFIIAPKQ
jgi:hypothetical protein